jgi:hypothetical protein
MNEMPETEAQRRARLRWVTLGESIAIAALVVSALGVYIQWKGREEEPTKIIEQRTSIPLTLRGKAVSDGRALEISPVENSHALQSLSVAAPGSMKPVEVGSDGTLRASELEDALGKNAEEGRGTHRVRVRIDARYVEAGSDKRAGGSYVLSYRWDGGGLFGGRSLRLTGISKA